MPSKSVNANTYVFDGKHYTRVTRILDVIKDEGIEIWKAKVGPEEAKRVLEEAAEFGTRVHTIVEGVNRDPTGYRNLDADLEPWYESYSEWVHDNVVEILAAETTVKSEVYRYAGTFDFKARLKDERRYMCDAKTNRTSVSPKARLQMAAYSHAERENGDDLDMLDDASGRLVIWMPSSKPGKLVPLLFDDDQEDWFVFESTLRVFRWREAHKNDWKRSY